MSCVKDSLKAPVFRVQINFSVIKTYLLSFERKNVSLE